MSKKNLVIANTERDGEIANFHLNNEDHTLGNALRYMVMKNPNVKFCGYSIPHPNERKVIMQIQMYPGKGTAVDALEKGFTHLAELCRHVKATFAEAHLNYSEKQRSMDNE